MEGVIGPVIEALKAADLEKRLADLKI